MSTNASERRAVVLGALLSFVPIMGKADMRDLGARPNAERWLDEVLTRKGLSAPATLRRFHEPIYYLVEPFTWTPNPDNGPEFEAVTVPTGFVTDLASIPELLFPWMRADGPYAQAAIVHDYLYWFQPKSKDYADNVFRVAMRDLEVDPSTVDFLFEGVSRFGNSAWEGNASLRSAGEKRIIRKFPGSPAIRWSEWKKQDIF